MKKLIVLALMLNGCSAEVVCWYASYKNNTYAPPSFGIRGRTLGQLNQDVEGPIFQTQEALEEYIRNNNLKMCGKNPS